MKCPDCKTEMREDELFKGGAVTMLVGSPGKMKDEMRWVCDTCRYVDYVEKK